MSSGGTEPLPVARLGTRIAARRILECREEIWAEHPIRLSLASAHAMLTDLASRCIVDGDSGGADPYTLAELGALCLVLLEFHH